MRVPTVQVVVPTITTPVPPLQVATEETKAETGRWSLVLLGLVILAFGVGIGIYVARPGVIPRDADVAREPAAKQPVSAPPATSLPAPAPPSVPARSQRGATPTVPKSGPISKTVERPRDDTVGVPDGPDGVEPERQVIATPPPEPEPRATDPTVAAVPEPGPSPTVTPTPPVPVAPSPVPAGPAKLIVRAPYPVRLSLGQRVVPPASSHSLEIEQGPQSIQVTAPQVFLRRTLRLDVKGGETHTEQLPDAVKVWIASVPANGTVAINGWYAGAVPLEISVAKGPASLEFKWPDSGRSRTVSIEVAADGQRVFGALTP